MNIKKVFIASLLLITPLTQAAWIHIWNNTNKALRFTYTLHEKEARRQTNQASIVTPDMPGLVSKYIKPWQSFTFNNISNNPKELWFSNPGGVIEGSPSWRIKGKVTHNTNDWTNHWIEIQETNDKQGLKGRWYFLLNKGNWNFLKNN